MEKNNFNYQEYRDDLSNKLKEESNKDSRKELHEQTKETTEYKVSKMLRDDKREDRIEDSKKLKEEIEKQNSDNLRELNALKEKMIQYLDKFEDEAEKIKLGTEVTKDNKYKIKEEYYKKNYEKAVSGMKQSAENLRTLVDFFSENLDQFKNKGFRLSFEIDKLNSYNSAMGGMFYDLGFYPFMSSSDYPNDGRVRVKVQGPSHGDEEESKDYYKNFALVDIYFPADAHTGLKNTETQIEDFKNKIKTYLENIEAVPVHKIR